MTHNADAERRLCTSFHVTYFQRKNLHIVIYIEKEKLHF